MILIVTVLMFLLAFTSPRYIIFGFVGVAAFYRARAKELAIGV
jgi:hypothetical protein